MTARGGGRAKSAAAGPGEGSTPSARLAGVHLVLVGLPGAGKTAVGRRLATLLQTEFIDLDEEIARRTGMDIPRIFAEQGERHFRSLERRVTVELRGAPGQVVSPGGGWMLDKANVALLRPPSRLVHLRVRPETALSRLRGEIASRPLLQGDDPLTRLALLWKERSGLYESADAEVDTELLDIQEVTDIVRALASEWGWRVG